MVTENINIDVRPGGIPIVIHVTQYEVGLRQFIFTPYTSNGTQTVVAGSATLEGTKPDGYAFQQACEMVDGVITYTLQEQLCAVEGRVWSRLVIRDTDGGMIGYTAIVWVVGRAGVADDAVMSDSDISALRQFLDEFGTIDAYRGALNGALAAVGGPLVAATASAMTDTTKVYVYTGSESGYTEGHWYYWNGSAWTDGGVYQSTGINTDKTLTVEDMAADAKATGDAVAELKNDFIHAVPFYEVSNNAVGYVWIENHYPSGTILTWENTGSTSNILIGHYESDKTTRIGANTTITPGNKTNITIPNGNIAYISVYFYGSGSCSYHTQKGVYSTVRYDMSQELTDGEKTQARSNIDAASNTQYQVTKATAESLQDGFPYYAYSNNQTGYIWVENPYISGTVLTWKNTGTTNNILIGHYQSDKTTRIGANTVIEPGKSADIAIPVGSVAYIALYFYGAGTASYHTQKGIYQDIADTEKRLGDSIDETNNEFKSIVYNSNMLDNAVIYENSDLNYNTGAISSGTKTLYKIEVTPGGTYYFTQLSGVYMYICLYKDDMTFIDNMYHYHGNRGNWNAEWTVPANCKYVVVWVDSSYTETAFWGLKDDYAVWSLGFAKILSKNIYSGEEFVTIGTGCDFATVKEGFAFAVANDMKALVLPGVYDLIEEGATGEGLVLPKEVWGYGATLICKPSSKNWTISAVNVDRNGTGTKVYGLRIECENCRYCIHDEMGFSTTDYYHNVFKDLTLIHESEPDETLIYPQAIGGGLGDGGFIEIENVVCDTAAQRCISYHSYAHNDGQGQPIPQTKPCTIIIKDSYFSGNVHGASSGTWTTVKNTMYVSNCSIGDAISYGEGYNMIVKGWNNVQRN